MTAWDWIWEGQGRLLEDPEVIQSYSLCWNKVYILGPLTLFLPTNSFMFQEVRDTVRNRDPKASRESRIGLQLSGGLSNARGALDILIPRNDIKSTKVGEGDRRTGLNFYRASICAVRHRGALTSTFRLCSYILPLHFYNSVLYLPSLALHIITGADYRTSYPKFLILEQTSTDRTRGKGFLLGTFRLHEQRQTQNDNRMKQVSSKIFLRPY
jgi:hypothetical protein